MRLERIEQHQAFGGQQLKYRHHSDSLHCSMTFSLYLPKPSASPTSLIWWLSGLTCTDDNFSQKGAFQKYASQENVAFLIPDTSPRGELPDDEAWDLGQGAGFYVNATCEPWKQNYQMYDYLVNELPEIVYDLIPNYSGKESIMGHSMGGHGALIVGLKQPERFSAISAFAPILNPSNVPWGKKAFTAYLGTDETTWKTWDATELLQKVGEIHPPILLTQGTADPFYAVQLNETAFLANVKDTDEQVRYEKKEGYDHSYFTIATFIEEHLAFHCQQFHK